jgi:hypothetical protein
MYLLRSSPAGALAWAWNRDGANGIWVAPRDGAPPREVLATDELAPFWGGEDLYAIGRGAEISKIDLATGRIEPYVSVPIAHGEHNADAFALSGGDLLLERTTSIRDLALITRVP